MGIEPGLQEQGGGNHIDLTAHLFLVQTLFAQDALCLGGREPLVDEFERKAGRGGDAAGDLPNVLGLWALLARHGLRQAADQDIGLMVFQDHTEGTGHALHLARGQDLERHGHATGAVGDRDAGARAADIEGDQRY